jgi:acetylornithine deacetylase/succinyl-diaminopimelate desuccinylase-like protein
MKPSSFTTLEKLEEYYRRAEAALVDDLFTFIRFQTISARPGNEDQFDQCARWICSYLERAGFETQMLGSHDRPSVLASYMAGEDLPTVLFYNHYDVQPVDPLDAWEIPPFEPVVQAGEVYGRGASDNKGQCLYVMAALRALVDLRGKLPLNVKVCIDAEEESGSRGLFAALEGGADAFSSDFLLVVDVGIPQPGRPSVSLGVRGIVTMTVEVVTSREDLHSGSHGGLAPNPIHHLVEILSSLRDPQGRITLPGFYEDVEEPDEELIGVLDFSFDPQAYEESVGARPTGGEKAHSPLERVWLRPTLEINGICGGYCGPGFKTVIPARAQAKISCRLVPNQRPQHIAQLLQSQLMERASEDVQLNVRIHEGMGEPCRCPPNSTIAKALMRAYEEVLGGRCTFRLEGGSIPVASRLAALTGAQTIFMGYSLPTDRAHAPNERFGLDRLRAGFLTVALGTQHLAGL